MRIMKLMIAAAAMTCATAQAGTVVSGCTPNTTPGVEFGVSSSQLTSITVANLNSVLASGLAALASGRQVEVLYDDSTSNCFATQIAVGGFHGECP